MKRKKVNFKLMCIYYKNVLFYLKNYNKILNVYEDDVSKKLCKKYIRTRLLSPLYYFKILNCDKNELNEIKKLVKFSRDNEFMIENLKFNFPNPHPYIKNTKYDIVTPEVFLYHLGLKNLEKNILNKIKNGNIIDCGAFIGDSSIILSRYTDHKVFALEPDERIFRYLVENIKKNNLDNKVIPINYGVGDKEEILYFGETKLRITTRDNIVKKIKVTTIDNIVKKEKIDNVSLIKMDIEGYELKALKGGKKTIKEHKPILIISAYHKREDILEIPYYLKDLVPEYRFRFLNLRKSDPVLEKVIIAL